MAEILLALKALSIWSKIGSLFDALAGWIIKHPVGAALAFSLLGNVGVIWLYDHEKRAIVTAHADQAQAEKALTVEQATNKDLMTTNARQNLAVMQLGKISDTEQAAADKADDAAVDRSKSRAAQASAIAVPPAGPAQADCRTPSSVMAAKESL